MSFSIEKKNYLKPGDKQVTYSVAYLIASVSFGSGEKEQWHVSTKPSRNRSDAYLLSSLSDGHTHGQLDTRSINIQHSVVRFRLSILIRLMGFWTWFSDYLHFKHSQDGMCLNSIHRRPSVFSWSMFATICKDEVILSLPKIIQHVFSFFF